MSLIVVLDKSINTVGSAKVVLPVQNPTQREYISNKGLRLNVINSKERDNKNCFTVYNPDVPNRVSKNQVRRLSQAKEKIKITKNGYDAMINAVSLKPDNSFKNLSNKNNILFGTVCC